MNEEGMITCCMDHHQRCNAEACKTCGWNKEEQERRKAFLRQSDISLLLTFARGEDSHYIVSFCWEQPEERPVKRKAQTGILSIYPPTD